MKTHAKKKVEVIVERPLLRDVIEVIDELGATGYTVLPTVAGRGQDGPWRADDVSSAFDRVMIVVITGEDVAERIVERAYHLLQDYNAIVILSDVAVVRGDRF